MKEKKRTGNNHRHDSCGCRPHQIITVMKGVYVGYVGLKEPAKGERNCSGFVFYLESTGFIQTCRFGDRLIATCSEN
jgi:phage gp37-like protein